MQQLRGYQQLLQAACESQPVMWPASASHGTWPVPQRKPPQIARPRSVGVHPAQRQPWLLSAHAGPACADDASSSTCCWLEPSPTGPSWQLSAGTRPSLSTARHSWDSVPLKAWPSLRLPAEVCLSCKESFESVRARSLHREDSLRQQL